MPLPAPSPTSSTGRTPRESQLTPPSLLSPRRKATSSALTHANSGVLCLDGALLLGSGVPGSRARAQQLQHALASACLVLDRRHPELQVG